jgi:hypothetical protein
MPDDRRTPYDLNVKRWEDDHPGWYLTAGLTGSGLRARPKRRKTGWISAGTLDELADRIAELATENADPS